MADKAPEPGMVKVKGKWAWNVNTPIGRKKYDEYRARQGRVDTDEDRDTDTDEDFGTDAATTEAGRRKVANKALGGLSDEFKKTIGPGLAVLLEQQGVSQADVEEWQSASPNDSVDLVKAAKGALGKRIAKNYPKWDDAKINQYINQGTASDGPKRGMPEGEFPPAESLPSVGEPDYSMPMQEGEHFPPAQSLPPGNPDQAPLKAPSQPEAEEGQREDAEQRQEGANRSAVPSSYKDRLEQMFQVYK